MGKNTLIENTQRHAHTPRHTKEGSEKSEGQKVELVNEAGLDERGSFDITGLLSLCWQLQSGSVPTGQMLRPGHLIW